MSNKDVCDNLVFAALSNCITWGGGKSIGGTNVGFLALLLSIQGEVKDCRLTSNGSILY